MRPENVPVWFNGTEIGKALRGCKQELVRRQQGDRMIVLVTDGESADLFGDAADTIADELKREGVTVFAIIIGMDSIQDEIITITSKTGGEAFLAGDPTTMKAIFKRIDEMKQSPTEKKLADLFDFTKPFCFVGLALLACQVLASFGLREVPW
jgi:Ca-activated chloride channel family protein